MTGTVVGGWNFVWAAYGLTFAVFVIYGVMLVTKVREEISRASRNEDAR